MVMRGTMSPRRIPMINPANRLVPMEVSMQGALLTAMAMHPPPKSSVTKSFFHDSGPGIAAVKLKRGAYSCMKTFLKQIGSKSQEITACLYSSSYTYSHSS